jgi:hypothetical protein
MNAGLGGNPSAGVVLGGLDYGLGGLSMPPGGGGYPAPAQYGAQQAGASQAFGFGAAPTATQGFGGGFGGAPQQGFGGAPFGAQQPAQQKPAAAFNPFDM